MDNGQIPRFLLRGQIQFPPACAILPLSDPGPLELLLLLSWELEIRWQDVLPTTPGKIALEQPSSNCKIFQKIYYTNNSGIGGK